MFADVSGKDFKIPENFPKNLKGHDMNESRIALVTGGNKGIGYEICRQLMRRGCHVLLGARNRSEGEAAVAALTKEEKGDIGFITIDLNDPRTFSIAQADISARFGKLDILVNNAGIVPDGDYKVYDVPVRILKETFDTNFFALVELTQIMLPLIRKSPAGRIVNQSSILASLTAQSLPDSPLKQGKSFAYNASKTAVNAFTVHLADFLKGTPVKVNSAHPGSVRTAMNPGGNLEDFEGARTAVALAMLPENGPSGGFFYLDTPLPW